MTKKTAVEWLWEQIPFEFTSNRSAYEAYQEAKEMECNQMITAFHDGGKKFKDNNELMGEQYPSRIDAETYAHRLCGNYFKD